LAVLIEFTLNWAPLVLLRAMQLRVELLRAIVFFIFLVDFTQAPKGRNFKASTKETSELEARTKTSNFVDLFSFGPRGAGIRRPTGRQKIQGNRPFDFPDFITLSVSY